MGRGGNRENGCVTRAAGQGTSTVSAYPGRVSVCGGVVAPLSAEKRKPISRGAWQRSVLRVYSTALEA